MKMIDNKKIVLLLYVLPGMIWKQGTTLSSLQATKIIYR